MVLGQLSACNRIHEVEERLARRLLMVHDRVGTNELMLTQEFIGEMLGVGRSGVNLAIESCSAPGTSRAAVEDSDPRSRSSGGDSL